MKNYLAIGLFCLVGISAQAAAPVSAIQDRVQSAQAFVQSFYDWYVERAKNSSPTLMEDALASKRWPMSDAIVTALREDMAAQAKSPDDIVGIDFDPFLNAQDECWPYKTRKTTEVSGKTRVEVFGHCEKTHPEVPDVVAELQQRDGKWVFVNFIYPGDPGQEDSDLLSALKSYKEEREHPAKE